MTRHLTERLVRLSLLAYFVGMSVALLTLVSSWLKPLLPSLVALERFAVGFLFLASAVVVSALVYGIMHLTK